MKLSKITAIFRNYTADDIRFVLDTIEGGAIRSVEIAMNSKNGLDILKTVIDEYGDSYFIGAGTVTDSDILKDVIEAGASFVLSPSGFDEEMYTLAKEAGIITVPGAMTPTEISKQYRMGADIVKIFPAGNMGAEYISAVTSPLDGIPLMAVGGVNAANYQTFLENGCDYVGIGSSLFSREDIEERNKDNLLKSMKKY